MPEEENPFLMKPKPAHKEEPSTELFGSDEAVSFMVSPDEGKKKHEKLHPAEARPHWESSGTPIWDKKKVGDIHNPDFEVVEHKEDEEN
ncbi:MAG: hypothetical protein U9R75_12200 [Candidatus Thermoplasmatota archaeon]|nr:hypothetical protein [Candidatus Thermoplasmatota archaeon]